MRVAFPISLILHAMLFVGAAVVVSRLPQTIGVGSGLGSAIEIERAASGSKKVVRSLAVRTHRPVSSASVDLGQGSEAASGTAASEGSATLEDILGWGNEGPEYPAEAIRKGWEGDVKLRLVFSSNQNAVEVVGSSGYSLLDDAAKRAALHWKLPLGQAGSTAKAWIIPVEFRIKEQG